VAKLTQKQWDKIKSRLDAGDKAIDLAKEYGITRGAISNKFAKHQKIVREVANQIVSVEKTIQGLPIAIQIDAFHLANELMAISTHVSQGARYGAMTFHRLAGVANMHAQRLNDDAPDEESLLMIAKLTKTGNEAASPALNLLAANKAAIERINEDNAKESALGLIELDTSSWSTEQLITVANLIPNATDQSAG